MKNLTFFSCLLGGIVFSGWGCFALYRSEESLPRVGSVGEIETLSNVQKTLSIPEAIDFSNISTQYKKLPCLKDTFTNISSWDTSGSDSKGDSGIIIQDSSSLKGCLSVWWDKSEKSEKTIIGNISWSMTDGDNGTIFLSQVSVTNQEVKKVNEKLYFVGSKGEDDWEVLVDKAQADKKGDSAEEEKYNSSGLGNGWKTTETSTIGKLDLKFVNKHNSESCNEECEKSNKWIENVIKWLKEDSLLKEVFEKYESYGGRFEQQE